MRRSRHAILVALAATAWSGPAHAGFDLEIVAGDVAELVFITSNGSTTRIEAAGEGAFVGAGVITAALDSG